MNKSSFPLYSEMEKQILKEIMNIAFGSASGDLEDMIGISLILHIPEIDIIPFEQLQPYLEENLSQNKNTTIIEELFNGNFSGSGLMFFPKNIDLDLLHLLSGKENINRENTEEIETIKLEVFLEIGNILVGACVGKITELLKASASYKPPSLIEGDIADFNHILEYFNEDSTAIVLKTDFNFRDHDLKGNLLVVTSHQSVIWMKTALNSFLEAYR